MKNKIRLLCDTNQMAYGSSSALLAILRYLPTINTAFAWGITEEFLTNSELINNIIKINNKDADKIKNNIKLNEFDAVLVVSNLTNINWYLDYGIPVFFVDLHHWYPSKKTHRVWKEAKKCFVERFFVAENSNMKNVINVGPIITIKNNDQKTKKQVLVNIGGGENRWIKPGKNSNYINIVLEIIENIIDEFNGYKFIIAAGKKTVEQIKDKNFATKIKIGTFSQDNYLNLLNQSEILITSPGLNAVFEGLYYRKKIIFLPPQNASQIIQLKYYENVGIVKKGLNLTEYFGFNSLKPDNFDEKQLTNEVLHALKQLETNNAIRSMMINHIKNQIKYVSNPEYIKLTEEAINILGEPGAELIAKQIISSLEL